MRRSPWYSVVAWLLILTLGVGGYILGIWLHGRQQSRPVPLVTISFLDIADGDCSIVRTPDNRFVVIDAGGPGSDNQVASTLRRMGAGGIDLLVLAAPAESAVGGVPSLVNSGIPIRSVWLNSVARPGETQTKAVDQLRSRHIPIRVVHENEQTEIGNPPMQFKVVWPPRHGDRSFQDSLVCRVDYGCQSCLFMGPLDAASEPYVISGASRTAEPCGNCPCAGDQLNADVLQVTAHGDGEGTAHELLRRVQPEIAVISSTPQDPPAPATVNRLQAAGADIWRTDAQGTVTVTLSMNAGTPVVTGSKL